MIKVFLFTRCFSTTGVAAAAGGACHFPGTIQATIRSKKQEAEQLARKDKYDTTFSDTKAVQIQESVVENVCDFKIMIV